MAPIAFRAPVALLLAFAVFAFSPLAFAASVGETALLYVADGEVSATNVSPFSSSGSAYYMVAVAGKEAVLLAPNKSDFRPVSDNATLLSVLPAYISVAYAGLFSEANLAALKTDISVLNLTFDYCDSVMKPFLANSFMVYYLSQIDDRGSPIPKTQLAIARLSGNKTVDGTAEQLAAGILLSSQKISALSADVSPEEMRRSLVEVYDAVSAIKGLAESYSTDFNFLESRHPDMFRRRTCALSSSSFSNLTDDLRLKDSIPSAESLASALIASTPRRAEYRQIREIGANASKKMDEVLSLFNSTQNALAGSGVELSGLNKSVADLGSKLSALRASANLSSAKKIEAEFNTAYNSTYGWLYEFSSTSLAQDIAASVNATADAKNATANAAIRLGENNEDVLKVKQRFKAHEASLKSNLSAVQNATAKVVPAAVFQNLTISANEIAKDAEGMRPSWAQNELVIVAVGVILLAVGFAIVIWYRNQKAVSEVSARISDAGNRKMEERER
ncbi:MAG: hypothetical protein WC792_01700 [Candidatus Micrarchaeia archaeon]